MLTIRPMTHEELEPVYRHVERDFPPIEYPPLHKMKLHFSNNAIEGQLFASPSLRAAYAFLLRAEQERRVMLFLYAVEPKLRGQGVGSQFLNALFAQYAQTDGMYAEVEKAELAPTHHEAEICRRRISFYKKLGFVRVHGLHYSIYGVEMHLFYRPLACAAMPTAAQAIADVTRLYEGILLPEERFHLDARKTKD